MKSKNINQLVLAGVLCGIGIVVPILMPKIVIGPMSFTLASHVAIFIAMFISPKLAAVVCLGTTLAFYDDACNYCSEAASHICFALLGAVLIRKYRKSLKSHCQALCLMVGWPLYMLWLRLRRFTFLSGRQHFQTGTACRRLCYERTCSGRVGTFLHSLIDYTVSIMLWKPVRAALPSLAELRE